MPGLCQPLRACVVSHLWTLGSSSVNTVIWLGWSQSSPSVIHHGYMGYNLYPFCFVLAGVWGSGYPWSSKWGTEAESTLNLVITSGPHLLPLSSRGLPTGDQWCVCNTCCELSSEGSFKEICGNWLSYLKESVVFLSTAHAPRQRLFIVSLIFRNSVASVPLAHLGQIDKENS